MKPMTSSAEEDECVCPIHGIDFEMDCEECSSALLNFIEKNYLHFFIIKMMRSDDYAPRKFKKEGLSSFKSSLFRMKMSAFSLLKELEKNMSREDLIKIKDSDDLIRFASFEGVIKVVDSIMEELDKVSEVLELEENDMSEEEFEAYFFERLPTKMECYHGLDGEGQPILIEMEVKIEDPLIPIHSGTCPECGRVVKVVTRPGLYTHWDKI